MSTTARWLASDDPDASKSSLGQVADGGDRPRTERRLPLVLPEKMILELN